MDAAQEARAAEINAALRKRGADEATGADRTALRDELATLLGVTTAGSDGGIAPEKQRRLDEINRRLFQHATATDPTQRMTVIEQNELAREAAAILVNAGGGANGETTR